MNDLLFLDSSASRIKAGTGPPRYARQFIAEHAEFFNWPFGSFHLLA